MSTALLGNHFDVHGGGIDNMFPHHENEIAQSEPLCGRPWVRYWLHPEHLDLKDVKMSKSLGNVIGIDELLEQAQPRRGALVLRARSTTARSCRSAGSCSTQAAQGYARIKKLVTVLADKLRGKGESRCHRACTPRSAAKPSACRACAITTCTATTRRTREAFLTRFIDAMDDDLNTPNAVAALFDYVSALYAAGIEQSDDLAVAARGVSHAGAAPGGVRRGDRRARAVPAS